MPRPRRKKPGPPARSQRMVDAARAQTHADALAAMRSLTGREPHSLLDRLFSGGQEPS
jgi:hypothetical protein